MISAGDSGETSSCSNVPSSRSRATDSAGDHQAHQGREDRHAGRHRVPGVSRFGLNQTRGDHGARWRGRRVACGQLGVVAVDDRLGVAGDDLGGVRAAGRRG